MGVARDACADVSVRLSNVSTLTGSQARTFWKALMDNASRLIADAHLLLQVGSHARARSLTVLAQEELGKALWVYDEFEAAWNVGDDTERTVDRLAKDGTRHVAKYLEAMVFGDRLAGFWGDYTAYEPHDGESRDEMRARLAAERSTRQERASQAARQANADKQRGFYVDLGRDGTLTTPTKVAGDAEAQAAVAEALQVAAQVIEMLLITDHSRMKLDASVPYDSTHEQQGRLLPVSHPDDWAAASEEFRRAATQQSTDESP
jgi:AbiV family abortive infection protein